VFVHRGRACYISSILSILSRRYSVVGHTLVKLFLGTRWSHGHQGHPGCELARQSFSQELNVVTPHGESALLEPCVFLARKVSETLDHGGPQGAGMLNPNCCRWSGKDTHEMGKLSPPSSRCPSQSDDAIQLQMPRNLANALFLIVSLALFGVESRRIDASIRQIPLREVTHHRLKLVGNTASR
jgi:hypothetical protein